MQKDANNRMFHKKLSSDNPQAEFENNLNQDQIEYVNLVYDAFFKKIDIEEKNLLVVKQIMINSKLDDKGFTKCIYILIFKLIFRFQLFRLYS